MDVTTTRWAGLLSRFVQRIPRRHRLLLGIGGRRDDVWWESTQVGMPSLQAIIEEARRRDIPWVPSPVERSGQLGHGVHQRRICGVRTDQTSALAQDLAGNKQWSKMLLSQHGIPVPKGSVVVSPHQLPYVIVTCGFPLVIKPSGGNKGRGVAIAVTTWREALRGFLAAKFISWGVVVERYHLGNDYRLLLVDGNLVAAAERTSARVVGDGKSTVKELIRQLNADPRRDLRVNLMSRVKVNSETRRLLRRQGHRMRGVLPAGEVAILKRTANLSTGGAARDVSDLVHPETVRLAERVSRLVGLDIIGLDIISPDISRPLEENDGVIIEVNADPGLRMHIAPFEGRPRNVAAPIVDMLFPPGTRARIPIVAVTGTNGKTTTTSLVSHMLRLRGDRVGWCTTEGIYIDGRRLVKQDAAGPRSAFTVLREPSVEAAVFEVARGGLLRSGLGFDSCDVGILLNVDEDHLGLQGIETLEQLAQLKGRVIEAVRPDGLAVLNGDDPRAVKQAARTRARVAYFTLQPENPLICRHLEQGGLAALCDGESIRVVDGQQIHRLGQVAELPMTFDGRAPFMVANALAAILAGHALGIAFERIWSALAAFEPSARLLPGRMNLIQCVRFHALVDYAHNAAGLKALSAFLLRWNGQRVGALSISGDRRDEDFIKFGAVCANTFDHVVVWEEHDTRGRRLGEASALLCESIRAVDSTCHVTVIQDEMQAFRFLLETAPDGALVALLAKDVDGATALVGSYAVKANPPEASAGTASIA